MIHDDLLEYREEFPILSRCTYLNSCSLGALSRRAEGYLAEFTDRWHSYGASAWYEKWMGRLADLRAAFETYAGAAPGSVALLPSTSVALSVIAESVDYSIRNRVVVSDLDFPTLAYQWAVKPGVELVVVRSEDGVSIDPEQFRAVVDERTAFLATSHVFFATGFRQDMEALAEIAHDAGALCLIDGYQGAGNTHLDLADSSVDFYTTGPLKWLLGGPGLSYLWANNRVLASTEPRITSWFAHADQFAFDLEHFRFHEDARRFEMGTPALPTVHTALGGQEILGEIGAEKVFERNRALTSYLVDAIESAGFDLTIATDRDRRTNIVMVRHGDAPGAVAHLAEGGIVVDHRPGHVRVSPHFYNTVGELDRFVEALGVYTY
jgi:selenocysteine lyase/cysteine desulfurase